eukprot:1381877-Pyramimonas_sp.AAC.1
MSMICTMLVAAIPWLHPRVALHFWRAGAICSPVGSGCVRFLRERSAVIQWLSHGTRLTEADLVIGK